MIKSIIHKELKLQLQSIEISHSFASRYNHGISKKENKDSFGQWNMFEPTRFVYAFFAFNMLYSVDWKSILGIENNKSQRVSSRITAKDQFYALVEFIHMQSPSAFEESLLALDANRDMYSEVSNLNWDKNSSQPSRAMKDETIACAFLVAAKKFSSKERLDANDHFAMLEMSYAVRNNLFHGNKKAHEMKEKGHRKRLIHYANIILATNDSFFEVMEQNFGYDRVENWDIMDNIF
jgi:hypothetical protein